MCGIEPFDIPETLAAKPRYYDYYHYLRFGDGNSVELLDGAGQAMNGEAKGSFEVLTSTTADFAIRFFNLAVIDPYDFDSRRVIGHLDDITANVTIETGPFAFHQEVVWRVPDFNKWPCLLFEKRFVFDQDPLAFCRAVQENNLYHVLENKELVESAKTYYPTGRELARSTLLAEGFPEDQIIPQIDPPPTKKAWWKFW